MRGLLLAILAVLGGVAACGDDGAGGSDAGALPDGASLDAERDDGGGGADGGADAPTRADAGLVRTDGLAEADGEVGNPDRGLYAWDWDTSTDLVLVKPHLGEWCDGTALPAAFLDGLRARLAEHRDAGRKVILRFVYADDAMRNACDRADAESVDVIEGHLSELAPLVEDHADMIAFVEAGLLGMWGEWNDEHAPAGTILWSDADNRRRVVEALLAAVPAERAILLRRPRFREELEGVLSAEELARIGHHNDCLFASETDYGTYDGARSVDEWKTYVATIARTAPVGGETCIDTPAYTSCDNALPELERLGYTYVHQNYQRAVLDRWRAEGCFEEIERRLGYRVVLRAVETPPERLAGEVLPVVVELENVGFAPPYTTRRPQLVLRAEGVEHVLDARLIGSPGSRSWLPGATVRVELEADVPSDVAPGAYELRLRLLDDRSDLVAHAMLLANDDTVRDDTLRENVLGRLTLR